VQVLKKQAKPLAGTGNAAWEDMTGEEEVIVNPTALTDGQAVAGGSKS
jgi:hypothetical protein